MTCNTISFASRLIQKCFRRKCLNLFAYVCSLNIHFSVDSFWFLCCIMSCESSGRFLWATRYYIEFKMSKTNKKYCQRFEDSAGVTEILQLGPMWTYSKFDKLNSKSKLKSLVSLNTKYEWVRGNYKYNDGANLRPLTRTGHQRATNGQTYRRTDRQNCSG